MARKKGSKNKKVETPKLVQEEIVETPEEAKDNRKLYLIQEVGRLRKLHADQVELGIHPDSKLEVLIANLDKELAL